MKKPFIVYHCDRWGGRFGLERFETFEAALGSYTEQKRRDDGYPHAPHLELHNEDNYDVDCSDGLSEDERDQVWSV